MKKIPFAALSVCSLFCLCISTHVSAHATPIVYTPETSSVLAVAPNAIRISFSERIEPFATSVMVYGPDGTEVPTGDVSILHTDPRTLHVPIHATATGSYAVSWNTISADDGHFTKGAFVYSVGIKSENDASVSIGTFQIQHQTDVPQAMTIWLELLGQAVLLGLFLLHIFLWRPFLSQTTQLEDREVYNRRWTVAVYLSFFLIVIGTLSYFLLESQNIAVDQYKTTAQSLLTFFHTTTGAYDLSRFGLALLFLLLFCLRRKKMLHSKTTTLAEWLLLLLLTLSALSRARISHAAASEFHPVFSVMMNWIHLMAKDVWIGGLIVLVCLFLPLLQKGKDARLYAQILSAFSRILSIALLIGGLTGLYIIWLHLKDPRNLPLSHWGIQFEGLAIFAVVLLGLRLYSSIRINSAFLHTAQQKTEQYADTYQSLWYTIILEMMTGIGVLYLSSVLIITTPPLPTSHTYTQKTDDQNTTLSMGEDPYADGTILVTATPHTDADTDTVKNMVVTLTNTAHSIGPIEATLTKEFEGGYTFPETELSPAGQWTLHVSAERTRAYNANATFSLTYPDDVMASHAQDGKHGFGWFEILLTITGILLVFLSIFLFRSSSILFKKSLIVEEYSCNLHSMPLTEFCMLIGVYGILLYFLGNLAINHHHGSFESDCTANGHAWHESVPERAGQVTSPVTVMGCMFGTGLGQYHFADERAYNYFMRSTDVQATLTLQADHAIAGTPVSMNLTFTHSSGAAVTDLTLEHDRIVHVIIVSSDHTIFAHIHPEDLGPISETMLQTGTFPIHYTFPKAGQYLVAIEYTERAQLFSQQFPIIVSGSPALGIYQPDFATTQHVDGYDVTLSPKNGTLTTGSLQHLQYTISKDGKPVQDLEAYLSAAMHISVVKDDLRTFIHTHAEVPQTFFDSIFNPIDPAKHVHIYVPDRFGPTLDAYVQFPTSGTYDVFGEFKRNGKVIVTRFSVKVLGDQK